METKFAAKHANGAKQETKVDTLIERFRKMRALNCTDPQDIGLDEYMWEKFSIMTRSHFFARMF